MKTQAEKIALQLEKLKAAQMPQEKQKRATIAASLARKAEILETIEPIQAL